MMTDGRIYTIETSPEPAGAGDLSTIGGWPVLAAGEPWPTCLCGARMVFFFQVAIPADIPAFGGDRLLVFQCPAHDDVPTGPAQLPDRRWDEATDPYAGPFWRILLRGPGVPAAEAEPRVEANRLILRPEAEEVDEYGRGRQAFKLGGVGSWAQDVESHRCACGTEYVLLCQVPENSGFDMWLMKDRDSYDTSDDQVHLFLGNEVYILACPARCHPESTWPVCQN